MKILTFHEWKDKIIKEDSKKNNSDLYFRWTKDEYYIKYGHYVNKMKDK